MPWIDYTSRYILWTLILWAAVAAFLPLFALIGQIGMLPYLLILFRFAPFFAMLIIANQYVRDHEDPPLFNDTMTFALICAVIVVAVTSVAFAIFNFAGWLGVRIMTGETPESQMIVFQYDRSLMQLSGVIAFLSIALLFPMRVKSLIKARKSSV